MPAALVYVVVTDDLRTTSEADLRKVVGQHLDVIGGPVDEADIETLMTGKGVIGIRYSAESLRVTIEAKRLTKLYFASLGVRTMDTLPDESLQEESSGKVTRLADIPVQRKVPPRETQAPQKVEPVAVVAELTEAPQENEAAVAEEPPAADEVDSAEEAEEPEEDTEETPPQHVDSFGVIDPDALLVESLLVLIAEHGAMRAEDLAERAKRSVEDVERILTGLAQAGYVDTGVASVVTLTRVGKSEAANADRGRKGVINLLLNLGRSLSVGEMAELLGVTTTTPKRAVKALIEQGYVERAGFEERRQGQTAHPRQLYGLTALGRSHGAEYDSREERKATKWTNPTQHRAGVIKVLLEATEPLTANEIYRLTGVSRSAVRDFLQEVYDPPYANVHTYPGQPNKFSLTNAGRALARKHQRAGVLPTLMDRTRPSRGRPGAMPAHVTVPAPVPVVAKELVQYHVTVHSPSAEVLAMLDRLMEQDGVTVEKLG